MTNALQHDNITDRIRPDAAHHAEAINSATLSKWRPEKIMLPTMDGLCFEKVKHIAYLEASGNYTVLHFTDARQVLVCKTLGDVEQSLSSDAFVRIHRSHTIHLRHIKKYTRGKGGHVLLQNGVTLSVSSGQREHFLDTLKKYFS